MLASSKINSMLSGTRHEANPSGTNDLGALLRAVSFLTLAKADALAARHALHCIPNRLVRTHPYL
jgi:hypothetical protein